MMAAGVCPLRVCVFMCECVPAPDAVSITDAKFLSPNRPALLLLPLLPPGPSTPAS